MYYFMYKLESNYCDLPLKNFNTDLMQNLTQLHSSTAKFLTAAFIIKHFTSATALVRASTSGQIKTNTNQTPRLLHQPLLRLPRVR